MIYYTHLEPAGEQADPERDFEAFEMLWTPEPAGNATLSVDYAESRAVQLALVDGSRNCQQLYQ